ncbi:MAG: regulatory iron-sulfur-containing complex subunit RicT [bacterium]|nr:regulatory iron-sulfur-containing complex subunit RicT [bacterium]
MEEIENTAEGLTESHCGGKPYSINAPEKISPFIGVEFKGNRRLIFSNPMEYPFRIGDLAVVQVEKGEDLGCVSHLLSVLPPGRTEVEYEVLRKATPKDRKTLEDYRSREVAARQICKEKIKKNELVMKLVDVEYQFDGRKLTFYFTADGRVDFRQLVKDLAAAFRTRIELRQIGARDETRRFGGLGPCGRPLCCALFIIEFCPITTQMAKDQNLPLNPGKISGCCGRLKCCLKHEFDEYHEALKTLPRWDTKLETKKGAATVEKIDIFNRCIFLRYSSGDVEKVEAQNLRQLIVGEYISPDESSGEYQTVSQVSESGFDLIPDDETPARPAESEEPVSGPQKPWNKKPQFQPHNRPGNCNYSNNHNNHSGPKNGGQGGQTGSK